MSLPLAARSASVARTSAFSAEPLASAIPVFASRSTSSMRTSLRFTRSWVFSTSVLRVSTFWFTSPTSRPTYFLVAQPEARVAAIRHGRTTFLIKPPNVRRSAPVSPHGRSRPGHVPAAGPDDDPLPGGTDVDATETRRAWRRVISQAVLLFQLTDDARGGRAQAADLAHRERGAPGKLGVAGEHGGGGGGHRGTLAPREPLRLRIVQRGHDTHRVDGDVEGLRAGQHLVG